MEKIREIFTKNLKRMRNDAGYSQQALADKVEITLSGYTQIEYGKVWPKPETLEMLSRALGAPVYELFRDGKIPGELMQSKGALSSLKQAASSKRKRAEVEMLSASKGTIETSSPIPGRADLLAAIVTAIPTLEERELQGVLAFIESLPSQHAASALKNKAR